MTSDEILGKPAADWSTTQWLREVALQLALLNERQTREMLPKPPKLAKVN